MQFSQALLAFAAVTAVSRALPHGCSLASVLGVLRSANSITQASVITVPRDTLDLEERANDSTVARDAGIELQARDAHVASDSDEVEEIPELEPRQTAAPTLVGGDDTGGRQERARQAKGGKLKRGADNNNPAPPAERDAAPLPTPAPAALDADDDDDDDADMDVRARQAGGGSKPKSAAGAGGANKPKTAQAAGDKPQKSVQAGTDKPKSAVVRDVEPRATPAPDLEERDEEVGEGEDDDDVEELEARQEPPAANEGTPKKSAPGGGGGSLEPVQGRGLKRAPKPAVVRHAEPRATPAPDLKEREEEDDDAEEQPEARQEKTQGGGGAKPPATEKNPGPTVTVKVRAACTPVRREPQTVYVPVTPARVAERQPEKTAVFDA